MNTDFKEGGHDYEVLQGKCRLLMDLDLKWSDNDDILSSDYPFDPAEVAPTIH